MAFAKKCDRCKSYYDKNKGIKSINGHLFRGIRLETSEQVKFLDLCDPCIYELYTFLGLSEEEKDDE